MLYLGAFGWILVLFTCAVSVTSCAGAVLDCKHTEIAAARSVAAGRGARQSGITAPRCHIWRTAENASVLAARRLSAAPRIKRLQAVCSRSGLTLLSSGAPRHAGVSALAGASGSEPPETISY